MEQNKTKYCVHSSTDTERLFANPGRPDPSGKLFFSEQRPSVDAMSVAHLQYKDCHNRHNQEL